MKSPLRLIHFLVYKFDPPKLPLKIQHALYKHLELDQLKALSWNLADHSVIPESLIIKKGKCDDAIADRIESVPEMGILKCMSMKNLKAL